MMHMWKHDTLGECTASLQNYLEMSSKRDRTPLSTMTASCSGAGRELNTHRAEIARKDEEASKSRTQGQSKKDSKKENSEMAELTACVSQLTKTVNTGFNKFNKGKWKPKGQGGDEAGNSKPSQGDNKKPFKKKRRGVFPPDVMSCPFKGETSGCWHCKGDDHSCLYCPKFWGEGRSYWTENSKAQPKSGDSRVSGNSEN
jgi:hypothetical protein